MRELSETVNVKQAVILAGGKGERLKPFTDSNPKPMFIIDKIPFLERLIKQVKSFGINEIVILVGYLAEKITDYFGNGEKWGITIRYSYLEPSADTGSRIKHAYKEGLIAESFLLMYCDNYCAINFWKHAQNYIHNNALIQLTVYSNKDNYTKNNMKLNDDGLVEVYDKTRSASDLQVVDIGYAIVNRKVLELLPEENMNFEKEIYPQLVDNGKLYATVVDDRYYSVGDWKRIELTQSYFSHDKYIFLDRDGTINTRAKKADYVKNTNEFIWLPGAKEAIKKLKDNGYKIIIISNQPGVARQVMTKDDVFSIQEEIQRDLSEIDVQIDDFFYCMHNWDDGCDCRKPKPGMFYDAQKKYSIDLKQCWMIGDDERDMHAGAEAGCKCMMVSDYHPLSEIVDYILKMEA